MNYKYVIINLSDEYYKPLCIPLSGLGSVQVRKKGIGNNSFLNQLFFLHWSKKVNHMIRLPLKSVWYKEIYANPFHNNDPICFVFGGGKYITESKGLRKYILRQNPHNKCIIYCGDLIAKKGWNVEEVKKSCDAIVTYDPGEAQKYGIYCFDKPVYGRIQPLTEPKTFEYDAYFLGLAKDRLDLIKKTYQKLTDAGLKCLFIVCGVKEDDRDESGIRYQDPISYEENIRLVQKSKCLVEIIQGGSSTITLRAKEAMAYHRKLLTNYNGIEKEKYYNPKYMSTFNDPDEIDKDFIRNSIDYQAFGDNEEYLDPVQLLDFFEAILEEKDHESTNQCNNPCI